MIDLKFETKKKREQVKMKMKICSGRMPAYTRLERTKRNGYRFILVFVIGILFFATCGEEIQSPGKSRPDRGMIKLEAGKWLPDVKTRLETLIAENANQGKIVVFDFDNTIICRDIGEATFALMVKEKKLTPASVPKAVSPSFTLGRENVILDSAKDLTFYYESLLVATRHQAGDNSLHANGYAWVVQIMSGLTPADIVDYTKRAYKNGTAEMDSIDPKSGVSNINDYLQPFFYPEMVDLLGLLLKNRYDVYVVSASNVWTVRWMVTQKLNPLIQAKHGNNIAIAPGHVLGVNVLLRDKRTGMLYKDPVLIGENPAYSRLDAEELTNYELTSQVVYPLTGYFGKVANILKYISLERPFLIAGDSPNDLPMLNRARYRLWLARLEKKDYQDKVIAQINDSLPGKWFLQPVLYKNSPGFVPSGHGLNKRLKNMPSVLENVYEVFRLLKKSGNLQTIDER